MEGQEKDRLRMLEHTETFGARIRQFLRELFGSRLTERLELDLLNLRNDMERQLHDRDVLVATLREEKQQLMSKVAKYELAIMPHSSRMGAEVAAYVKPTKPNFSFTDIGPTKSRWEQVQDAHNAQMAKELAEEAAEKEKAAQSA
jgi:hypothetical protein